MVFESLKLLLEEFQSEIADGIHDFLEISVRAYGTE